MILLHPFSESDRWLAAFESELPDMRIQMWPDVTDLGDIRYAIVGLHDVEDFLRYPNLRAVLAMSAGVEQFRSLGLPGVPIVRLADDAMSNEMAAYALHWIVYFQKRFDLYRKQQQQALWKQGTYARAHSFRVAILGYGTIGSRIGELLTSLDYQVNAWSRTARVIDGVSAYFGIESLEEFLGDSDVVINVLPSTVDTRGLMGAQRFAHMRPGAIYILMGRGATTNVEDLIDALDTGHLHAAVLDVVRPEPLPASSPLWSHPKVHITPHVAGFTMVETASTLIAANIRRLEAGDRPFPLYEPSRGY